MRAYGAQSWPFSRMMFNTWPSFTQPVFKVLLGQTSWSYGRRNQNLQDSSRQYFSPHLSKPFSGNARPSVLLPPTICRMSTWQSTHLVLRTQSQTTLLSTSNDATRNNMQRAFATLVVTLCSWCRASLVHLSNMVTSPHFRAVPAPYNKLGFGP